MAKRGYVRFIAIAITALAIFFSFIQPVQAATKRLTELQTLQESSYMMEFSWKQFKRYVIENPGDYQIVMYYTLSDRCEHCVTFEGELTEVAYSYYKASRHLVKEDNKIPTFFAKIEYTQGNQQAFQLSSMQSVPVLTLATKSLSETYVKTNTLKYSDKLLWSLGQTDFVDAGKFIEHVNKITHNQIDIRYTFIRTLSGTALILGALGVLFLLKNKLASLIQNRVIWVIGSAIVYILCVGGIAFTLIHSMPTFKYGQDQSGSLFVEEYIQKSQRGQYAGEGYGCALVMFLTAAALIGFTKLDKMKSSLKKEVFSLTLVLIAFAGFMIIHEVFMLKSPSYDPSFYPPAHYMTGPLSADQGTNI
mmetsp:Transcript_8624/g.9804  ORF Transcript_8624/g.9804 Transcript_8624/m.9804 type:complete len:362 (-) Transcript_8624:34-1119(-)